MLLRSLIEFCVDLTVFPVAPLVQFEKLRGIFAIVLSVCETRGYEGFFHIAWSLGSRLEKSLFAPRDERVMACGDPGRSTRDVLV